MVHISVPQILKIMNLTNLGVQEMNAKEIRETDGEIIPLLILIYAVDVFILSTMAGYLYESYTEE